MSRGSFEGIVGPQRNSEVGADAWQNWRLEPRMEAMIRLRYASILHEETDNIMEAETELSKGVCDAPYFLLMADH